LIKIVYVTVKIEESMRGEHLDPLIPPNAQRFFAQQMNATTISLPSSHASLISHPNEVAQLILNTTKGK